MFDQYPKTRPPLPESIRALYVSQYKTNREGGTTAASMAQRLESWLHRQVAADVADPDGASRATLELGAGTLNQLPYEPRAEPYDIVEPFTELFERSPLLPRVGRVFADTADVPADARYDRITSVATLEHICDLPDVVARCGLLLADGGAFRAGIPNEGTWLWTLGWKLTTGLEFRLRHGLDYGDLMRHEHVNTSRDIEQVVQHFFGRTRCKVFGISRGTALYRYYECRDPDLDRCRQQLDRATAR
ncbi:MAG: class I SAM-dependent methyltransferase [Acidobacteriota bacterium]